MSSPGRSQTKDISALDLDLYAFVLEHLGNNVVGPYRHDADRTGADGTMRARAPTYGNSEEHAYAQQAVASAKKISAALGPVDPHEVVRMIRADRDTR